MSAVLGSRQSAPIASRVEPLANMPTQSKPVEKKLPVTGKSMAAMPKPIPPKQPPPSLRAASSSAPADRKNERIETGATKTGQAIGKAISASQDCEEIPIPLLRSISNRPQTDQPQDFPPNDEGGQWRASSAHAGKKQRPVPERTPAMDEIFEAGLARHQTNAVQFLAALQLAIAGRTGVTEDVHIAELQRNYNLTQTSKQLSYLLRHSHLTHKADGSISITELLDTSCICRLYEMAQNIQKRA